MRPLTYCCMLKNGQIGRVKSACTSWSDYFLMEAVAAESRYDVTFGEHSPDFTRKIEKLL